MYSDPIPARGVSQNFLTGGIPPLRADHNFNMESSSIISNIITQLLIVIAYAIRKYLKQRGCIENGEGPQDPSHQEPENRAMASIRPSGDGDDVPRRTHRTRDNAAPTHGPV